jgi:hypothetical protein
MMIPTTTQATATDPLVVAIVSVSLTLIVGVVVGLTTALLTRKGEHAKWLRERRYEAYVAFMIDMDTVTTLIGTKPTVANVFKLIARVERHIEKASAAFEAVSLLGPREVNAAGQKWVWSVNAYEETKAAPEKTALSAARWQFLIVAGRILESKNVTTVPMTRPSAAPGSAVAPVSTQ